MSPLAETLQCTTRVTGLLKVAVAVLVLANCALALLTVQRLVALQVAITDLEEVRRETQEALRRYLERPPTQPAEVEGAGEALRI